jgi:hypothetical protein
MSVSEKEESLGFFEVNIFVVHGCGRLCWGGLWGVSGAFCGVKSCFQFSWIAGQFLKGADGGWLQFFGAKFYPSEAFIL